MEHTYTAFEAWERGGRRDPSSGRSGALYLRQPMVLLRANYSGISHLSAEANAVGIISNMAYQDLAVVAFLFGGKRRVKAVNTILGLTDSSSAPGFPVAAQHLESCTFHEAPNHCAVAIWGQPIHLNLPQCRCDVSGRQHQTTERHALILNCYIDHDESEGAQLPSTTSTELQASSARLLSFVLSVASVIVSFAPQNPLGVSATQQQTVGQFGYLLS